MTLRLICGRVCTKGEGKERLVRKRKRKRRREVNEHFHRLGLLPGNWARMDGIWDRLA
jgi:hypothetical protein